MIARPMRDIFEETCGTRPFVISMPHVGSALTDSLMPRLSPTGRMVPDTDWNLERLYDFANAMDVTIMRAIHSRYVIDLNRDPEGQPLYPGQNMNHPGLVPLGSFDDVPLYHPGDEPDHGEIQQRRRDYWQPYHDRLAEHLNNLKDRHGIVVLFDCHSIRSVVPRYQEGRINDLNLGTADGTSCSAELRSLLDTALAEDPSYTRALDDVFKGGYITRHYGKPAEGIHAFQLELSWAAYLNEHPTPTFDRAKADALRPTLKRMIETALIWVETASQ